ncbi:MAG: glycyl-radical enzyme activating protein [Firmicutes bacterium]|nr:glycyl-radical enzyme activating protein [Bacillota bacterium]
MSRVMGTVLSIERCSLHDGPGIRTTVFLKGCPLSCLWCHNPESLSFKPELYYFEEKCIHCGLCGTICDNHSVNEGSHILNREDCDVCGKCADACTQSAFEVKGTLMQAQDVMDIVMKDEKFYKQSGGGLTISGGEPLAQYEFTLELLRLAKENGLHTCIETCGFAPTDRLLSIVPYVDLFLYDFKESNEDRHKEFTGASNRLIIDNLFAIDKAGAKVILRCPIIPTCNDRDGHFTAIAQMANTMCNIVEVNIMPYHPMGASKAMRIGREYRLADIGFPTDEQVDGWVKAAQQRTNVEVRKG